MPLEKQKVWALVMQRLQNGGRIQMGPLSVLNYETATRVSQMFVHLFAFKLLFI